MIVETRRFHVLSLVLIVIKGNLYPLLQKTHENKKCFYNYLLLDLYR